MSDLISRQAAIDAILHNQEVYSNNFGNDPIDKYTIAIIDNDAQTIAQLPSAQPEQRWIPCNERLPKYGKNVLITNDKGNVSYGKFRGVEFWREDGDAHWQWKHNTIEHVLAWMPLPEPWRGEANEHNN